MTNAKLSVGAIPTGLCPPAQGLRGTSYLGKTAQKPTNPNGGCGVAGYRPATDEPEFCIPVMLVPSGARVCDPQQQRLERAPASSPTLFKCPCSSPVPQSRTPQPQATPRHGFVVLQNKKLSGKPCLSRLCSGRWLYPPATSWANRRMCRATKRIWAWLASLEAIFITKPP